jgi:mitosis inhibitor protein kinase SWE1
VDADTGRVVSTLDKRQGTDTNLPVLSDELLDVIKGLMRSHPARRMTLEEVWGMEVVQRVKGLMGRARRESAGVRGEGEEDEGAVWCGALVEEEEDAVELLFPCA